MKIIKYLFFVLSALFVFSCGNKPEPVVVSEDCKAVEALYSIQKKHVTCLKEGGFLPGGYPPKTPLAPGTSMVVPVPPEIEESRKTVKVCALAWVKDFQKIPSKIAKEYDQARLALNCLDKSLELAQKLPGGTTDNDWRKFWDTTSNSYYPCMNSGHQKQYEEAKQRYNCS